MRVATLPHIDTMEYALRYADSVPMSIVTLGGLNARLSKGYDLTTNGNFSDALAIYRGVLQQVPLLVVRSTDEEKEA